MEGQARAADDRTGSSRLRLPRTPFELWIAGLVVLGIAIRVTFYSSRFGNPDSDEAVGGLMARAVLHGHFSIFYWGQAYGGPFETWLAAPIQAIFGPSWLGLRLIPISFAAVTAILVWRVGLRTIGRTGALTAAALVWFFPSSLLWRTTNFYVVYAGAMMLGILTVLLVLRMWERPTGWGMFGLGLVAGFGIWQSFQLITIVPTAIVWLLVRQRGALRHLPVLLAGSLIGVAPVLVSNIRHDWWSRDIGHYGNEVSYGGRLWQFFTNGLPLAFDLRVPFTLHWFLWKPAALLLYGVVVVALLWRAWSPRARREQRSSEILLAILVVFPFVYAISPLTTFKFTAGYVLMLIPILMLGACAWIRSEAQAMFTAVVAVAFLAHSLAGLHLIAGPGRAAPNFYGSSTVLPRDFGPLIHRLNEFGIRRVYASYWIAYRITYASDGRIIAADMRPEALRTRPDGVVVPLPHDPDFHSRHPSYATAVARVAAPAFVIDRSWDNPQTDYGSLERAGYQVEQVGPFTIYHRGAASRGTGEPGS